MKQSALLITLIGFAFAGFSQEGINTSLDTLRISGKYNGKNLFVKNQFGDKEGFTVKSVSLNEELLEEDDFNASAFEIKFNERNQKIGDDLNIAIIYLKGRKPEVLNIEDIK